MINVKRMVFSYAAAVALGLCATSIQAQTSSYSASITLGTPLGTSGASNGVTDKKKPVGIKNLSCLSSTRDQLSFTIKFDAGKPGTGTAGVDSRQNVYLIFSKDSSPFYLIYRNPPAAASGLVLAVQSATAVGPSSSTVSTDLNSHKNKPYYKADSLLGGAQTEVFGGGAFEFTSFQSGIWAATLIVAPEATVDFDDPDTWSAWDTVPFLLRKPWTGISNTACE